MNELAYAEQNRTLRGHDFFTAEFLRDTPAFYATEDVPAEEKIITAHFFSSSTDYYVAEFDPSTGEAFGYANLNDLANAEWGYSDLFGMEQVKVLINGIPHIIERDVNWVPKKFTEIAELHPANQ